MKLLEQKKLDQQLEVKVELDQKVYQNNFNNIKANHLKQIKVPGYRPGKVPAKVAEKHVNVGSIINEAINRTMLTEYSNFVKANEKLLENAIEEKPEIVISSATPTVTLTLKYDLMPEVTLANYQKISIEYTKPKVSDNEVEFQINQLIKGEILASEKENGTIAKGDLVCFDFEGFTDGKPFPGGKANNYELEIGSGQFIPGFEDQMIGLKTGEEKTINVVFPEDYHAKDLAGKPAEFKIKVHKISSLDKPTLNKELIHKLGFTNANSEAELKAQLKERIFKYKDQGAKQAAIKKISETLMNDSKLTYFPKSLLEIEIQRLKDNTNNELKKSKTSLSKALKNHHMSNADYENNLAETAKKNLTLVLAIEKLIEELKIEVSQKEIDQELEAMAQMYNVKVEDLKQRLNNDLDQIKTYLMQNKLFDKLIEINQKK